MTYVRNDIQPTNQLICIDYLEISFKYTLPSFSHNPKTFKLNPSCYIEYLDVNNKFFCTVCNLYVFNSLAGELKYNPRTSFINDETIHFKVENHLLYTNDFISYVKYLTDVLGFEFTHIVRLDIASDCIKHYLLDSFKKYQNSKSIRLKGKPKKSGINLIGTTYQTVYIGSASSEKYIKIYNKSIELLKSNKKYIQIFWKYNGLDYINNEVERFELTLKQKHSKNINLFALANCNYLASIMQTHLTNFFDFEQTYISHSKKYIKNVTPIAFNKRFEVTLLPKFRYVPQYTLRPIKIEIKRLFIEHLIEFSQFDANIGSKENDLHMLAFSNYLKAIERLNLVYNLTPYYLQNKSFWKREFEKNSEKYLKRIENNINNCIYN